MGSFSNRPSIAFEAARAFGDVWALTELWKEMGFGALRQPWRIVPPRTSTPILHESCAWIVAPQKTSLLRKRGHDEQNYRTSPLPQGWPHGRGISGRMFMESVAGCRRNTQAHAAICFMVLILHRVMRSRLRASHTGLTPERALDQLHRIQHHRVRLNGAPPVSGVSSIQECQSEVLHALRVKKPVASQQLTLL